MIVDENAPSPELGMVKRLPFFGATPEETEHAANLYLGCAEPAN